MQLNKIHTASALFGSPASIPRRVSILSSLRSRRSRVPIGSQRLPLHSHARPPSAPSAWGTQPKAAGPLSESAIASVSTVSEAITVGLFDGSKARTKEEGAVIIGAGPAGLATAIMLAKRGYRNIKVYERCAEPPLPNDLSVWGDFEQTNDRLYMIGLNGRGQKVLRELGVMERISAFSSKVAGRMDWRPETPPERPIEILYTGRTYVTNCIQRDRLSACLLAVLKEKYSESVEVEFNVECEDANWGLHSDGRDRSGCKLTLVRNNTSGSMTSPDRWNATFPFVIGADGAASKIREGMERGMKGKFQVKRFEDTNVLVYRTIPLHWSQLPLPPSPASTPPTTSPAYAPSAPSPSPSANSASASSTYPSPKGRPRAAGGERGVESIADPPLPVQSYWRRDLNYSVRTNKGVSIDCLPTREGPHIGVVLYKPGDERVTALKNMQDAKAFFQTMFPQFMPLLKDADLERFATKKDNSLPRFSYAGPVLHVGDHTCLLGDTIHTVKPYFGQGVNSAFEDVAVLEQALESSGDNIPVALKRYSQMRAKDAKALVELSHTLDGGFLQFLLPLILDSTLNRLLPAIFSPNIIASFQNESRSFSEVRVRKRFDRAMQVVLLGGAGYLLLKLLSSIAALALKLFSSMGKMLT